MLFSASEFCYLVISEMYQKLYECIISIIICIRSVVCSFTSNIILAQDTVRSDEELVKCEVMYDFKLIF